MKTQIRLPLEQQSDHGLHCLNFHLHLFKLHFCVVKPVNLNFTVITAKCYGVRKLEARHEKTMNMQKLKHISAAQ